MADPALLRPHRHGLIRGHGLGRPPLEEGGADVNQASTETFSDIGAGWTPLDVVYHNYGRFDPMVEILREFGGRANHNDNDSGSDDESDDDSGDDDSNGD